VPEYVTFRRLIKLCYGSTFVKEGDRDLDVSESVRLIHMANAFECIDAVKQCATALINGDLDWEGAVQCIELTDMLQGVEGMRDLTKKAAGVVAKEAGPVHALFTPVKDHEDGQHGEDVLGGLRLSEKVKVRTHNLSIHASTRNVLCDSVIISDNCEQRCEESQHRSINPIIRVFCSSISLGFHTSLAWCLATTRGACRAVLGSHTPIYHDEMFAGLPKDILYKYMGSTQ
jgi:hypothetical protein